MTLMVDGIMVLVVLEAILLAVLGRAAILPNLAAGLMLLVAMRLALGDAGLPLVGLSLLGAGIAHLIDLTRRWN
jgi:hypothetical protein